MARPSIWGPKFNRDDIFLVNRPFRLNGVDLVPGKIFDKTQVSTRTLRTLFSGRKLRLPTPVEATIDKDMVPPRRRPQEQPKVPDRAYALQEPPGSGKWFIYVGKRSADRKRVGPKKPMDKATAFGWCDDYNRTHAGK